MPLTSRATLAAPGADIRAERLAAKVMRPDHPERAECRHGHLYDERNTYWSPSGRRDCRRCKQAAQVRVNEKRREARSRRKETAMSAQEDPMNAVLRPADGNGHVPDDPAGADGGQDAGQAGLSLLTAAASAVAAAYQMGYARGRADAIAGDLARRLAAVEEQLEEMQGTA